MITTTMLTHSKATRVAAFAQHTLAALIVCVTFLYAGTASAVTIVAGVAFDDDAFADTLIGSSGSYTTSGGSLASVLTDINASTWAFATSTTGSEYAELGFTDNFVVNGPGDDLAVFEIGTADAVPVSLTIGGFTSTVTPVPTGFSTPDGFGILLATYDLSTFGVALGGTVSSVVISYVDQPGNNPSHTIGLVGALNSDPVPEPSTVMLLACGALGICARVVQKCFRKQ